MLSSCARFHPLQHESVYVSARQVYLHDRVAAVSNRVALVTNGQQLEVIERGRRFLKVKTPKAEIGWLEEHAVIDEKLHTQFEDLAKKHSKDLVVATAQLRDDLYLHVLPGRDAEHFLLIPGNAKVQLLARGTVAKAAGPGMGTSSKARIAIPIPTPTPAKPPVPKTTVPKSLAPQAPGSQAKVVSPSPNLAADSADKPDPAVPVPVPMEDWWLVRDSQGHTGWLLAGRLDVDVPDEVGAYAEGQRMVGAYAIAKVTDYDSEAGSRESKKEAALARHKSAVKSPVKRPVADKDAGTGKDDSTPEVPRVGKEITEYVTVLSPPRSGLPYDFDQIRVFTWSLNHHRYETAYRLHGIQGYLPVRVSQETVNGQQMPIFSFQIANGPNVTIDPETGAARPLSPRTLAFRLEGNLIKRTGADQGPIELTHFSENGGKTKAAQKRKKH